MSPMRGVPPPHANSQLGQSKDHNMRGWVGGGLVPHPTLLSQTPLGEGGERNLGGQSAFSLGGKGGIPMSTPHQGGGTQSSPYPLSPYWGEPPPPQC